MSNALRVVVVGGVAAGPKTASRIIRLCPEAQVTVIEKGKFLSYAGCGLPYYISGAVKEQKELMCTPAGAVRDPVFFQKVKNVKVLNHTVALQIDRAAKKVGIAPVGASTAETWLEYDKLVLCTGARPVRPPLPGINLQGVYSLHGIEDAEGIKEQLKDGRAQDVVIVGGGLIGVEVTEALHEHGCRITIVEKLPQILTMLDAPMARLVEKHMESKGVRILTGTGVEEFLGGRDGNAEHVRAVKTSGGEIPADMVIMAIGVRPNVDLAKAAGLAIGDTTGAIQVNEQMQTSDPDIYAAGDCVEVKNLITGKQCFVPLGSTANKQGRVAANSICGVQDSFPGVLGSAVCRVFDYCVGRAGLSEREAKAQGYDVEVALAPSADKAHFMPNAKPLLLKLIADKKTRKLLGIQVAGPGEGDKRVDVAAVAITAGMTVDQLANLDLCYAPPYAPAVDNILTAANVLRNKLDGYFRGVSPEELVAEQKAGKEVFLLDCRSPAEHQQIRLPGGNLIPLGALREKIAAVPRDKPVVCFCKISLRGYEAALILKQAGYQDVRVLDGGILMWPFATEA